MKSGGDDPAPRPPSAGETPPVDRQDAVEATKSLEHQETKDRNGLCGVCLANDAKYKCPRCSLR